MIVLGASGIARALTELSAVSQLWSTSYGRALIVKTAHLRAAARARLAEPHRAAARRSPGCAAPRRVEVLAIVGIVVAVAILTELAPGPKPRARRRGRTAAAARRRCCRRATRSSTRASSASLAVAVAREPQRATVTIIGPDGDAASTVARPRRTARPRRACGSGCYRAPGRPRTGARLGRRAHAHVRAPCDAPDATALLARVTRAYRASRTIVFDETLASTPTNAQTTRFTVVAPNRLAYQTQGGASAIVIGARRWDRAAAGGRGVEVAADAARRHRSPTGSSRRTRTWSRPNTITFLDRRIPAWFRVTLRRRAPDASRT